MIEEESMTKQVRFIFQIDFHGTWFSGHSMTALAFYNDKSNSLSSNHHAKILIRSPSFNDTKVDVFYFRDNNVFKLLLEVRIFFTFYFRFFSHFFYFRFFKIMF